MTSNQDCGILLSYLSITDTKKRLSVIDDLLRYVQSDKCLIPAKETGQVIDLATLWIQSNNHKVTKCGLDVVKNLLGVDSSFIQPFGPVILSVLLSKFSDTRIDIREKTIYLIRDMWENKVLHSKILIPKMLSLFEHKGIVTRLEALNCTDLLLDSVECFDKSDLKKLLLAVVELWNNSRGSVQEKCMNILIKMNNIVREDLTVELQRKYSATPKKLDILFSNFGQITGSCTSLSSVKKKNTSINAGNGDIIKKCNSEMKSCSMICPNFIVDEEAFEKAFEDVPKITVFFVRDIRDQLNKISLLISDPKHDWKDRIDALRRFRSILINYADQDILDLLKHVETSFLASLKDLRSQVVKETCITSAFLCKMYGVKLEKFARCVLQQLLNLLMSSIKVIATSAYITVCFILKNVHSISLIPIVNQGLESKSRNIHRGSCEFLQIITEFWPESLLEKGINFLKDGIRKGISDADSEARCSARLAFFQFRQHFPYHADSLLKDLDHYQRTLCNETWKLPKSQHSSTVKNSVLQTCIKTDALENCPRNDSNGNLTTKKHPVQDILSGIHTLSPSSTKNKSSKTLISFECVDNPTSESTNSTASRNPCANIIRNIGSKIRRRLIKTDDSEFKFREQSFTSKESSVEVIDNFSFVALDSVDFSNDTCKENHEGRKKIEDKSFKIYIPENVENNDAEKSVSPVLEKLTKKLKGYLRKKSLTNSELIPLIKVLLKLLNNNCSVHFLDLLNDVIYEYSTELECYVQRLVTCLLGILNSNEFDHFSSSIQKSLDIVVEKFSCHCQLVAIFNYIENLPTEIRPESKIIICYYIVQLTSKPGVEIAFSSIIYSKPCDETDNIANSFVKITKWMIENTEKDLDDSKLKICAKNAVFGLFKLSNTYFFTVLYTFLDKYKDVIIDLIENCEKSDQTESNIFSTRESLIMSERSFKSLDVNFNSPSNLSDFTEEFCTQIPELFLTSESDIVNEQTSQEDNYEMDNSTDNKEKLVLFKNIQSVEKAVISSENSVQEEGSYCNSTMKLNFGTESLSRQCRDKLSKGDLDLVKISEIPVNPVSSKIIEDEKLKLMENNGTSDENMPLNQKETKDKVLNLKTKITLENLVRNISDDDYIKRNFRLFLRILLSKLVKTESPSKKVLVLKIMCKLVKKPSLIECFNKYGELVTLKILQTIKEDNKDVRYIAELCLEYLGVSLSSDIVMRTMVPLMKSNFPVNRTAIKVITLVIKTNVDASEKYMNKVVPKLIEAYNDIDSSVRKCAVFCLVQFCLSLGSDKLKVYLSELDCYKLKLLNLYLSKINKS